MPIYTNDEGKRVGVLFDRTYTSPRKKSKHLFRAMDAWGIDTKIVEDLIHNVCLWIEIDDVEEHIVYKVPFDTFCKMGVKRDFGHAEQMFLPRSYWSQTKKK